MKKKKQIKVLNFTHDWRDFNNDEKYCDYDTDKEQEMICYMLDDSITDKDIEIESYEFMEAKKRQATKKRLATRAAKKAEKEAQADTITITRDEFDKLIERIVKIEDDMYDDLGNSKIDDTFDEDCYYTWEETEDKIEEEVGDLRKQYEKDIELIGKNRLKDIEYVKELVEQNKQLRKDNFDIRKRLNDIDEDYNNQLMMLNDRIDSLEEQNKQLRSRIEEIEVVHNNLADRFEVVEAKVENEVFEAPKQEVIVQKQEAEVFEYNHKNSKIVYGYMMKMLYMLIFGGIVEYVKEKKNRIVEWNVKRIEAKKAKAEAKRREKIYKEQQAIAAKIQKLTDRMNKIAITIQ